MDEPIGYATRTIERLLDTFLSALPAIFAGVVVLAVFVLAARIARRLVRGLVRSADKQRRPLVELAGETVYYTVITLGLISGLGTMGIDVSALVAGLGLTGFALGFALRDAVSNLLAGVLILMYRPFGYGDRIIVAGNTGKVQSINFRYTVLEAGDGSVVHVPNSVMFTNSVTLPPAGDAPS